ncbi:hypothetical protein ENUP19_0156G0024 [Entamoeba nuttalli]|uniref:HD domain-containing protein n=2 Tax=Entamoeba nuttalli TaxID=412467 RepID=K2G5W2_ENTNP|nr:hypothetical protein ENU1_187520 [Entamoeba nuttalli P19]EKE37761.1 hypothetical protein ENU1_187520 [Entamoeba nuttalli P19]|eukprot:XP_008859919.1 hypothetical protein ENU1_187520 [Entamoeba nuttalli P19]
MSLIDTDNQNIINECKKMLRTTNTSLYVYSHSYKVMQLSLEIYDLVSPLCKVNKTNLIMGALLHDITKTRSLVTKEDHPLTGANVARELGCSEAICQIIAQHVNPIRVPGKLTEIDIVCYADKRVKWDYIVTMQERIDDVCIRYNIKKDSQFCSVCTQSYLQIEQEIGEYAKKNGQWDHFIEFIHRTEEGKVTPFIGMEKTDLI